MKIRLLYFARVRETLGLAEETLDWNTAADGDAGGADSADAAPDIARLCAHLRARGEPWQTLLAPHSNIKFAINQQFAGRDAPLCDNCEVAIFPPVTGG